MFSRKNKMYLGVFFLFFDPAGACSNHFFISQCTIEYQFRRHWYNFSRTSSWILYILKKTNTFFTTLAPRQSCLKERCFCFLFQTEMNAKWNLHNISDYLCFGFVFLKRNVEFFSEQSVQKRKMIFGYKSINAYFIIATYPRTCTEFLSFIPTFLMSCQTFILLCPLNIFHRHCQFFSCYFETLIRVIYSLAGGKPIGKNVTNRTKTREFFIRLEANISRKKKFKSFLPL